MADTLYDDDFVTWTERQAEELRRLAREGWNLPLDWENLAEEIEDLGKEVRHQVESLAFQIMVHILKLACSPAQHFRVNWMGEIDGFRRQLAKRLSKNPALRGVLDDIVGEEQAEALADVERLLRRFDGGRGLDVLERWKLRGLTAADVLAAGAYPESGSTGLQAEHEGAR